MVAPVGSVVVVVGVVVGVVVVGVVVVGVVVVVVGVVVVVVGVVGGRHCPVLGSIPKPYTSKTATRHIKRKGIITIIHDTMLNSWLHKTFNTNVTKIVIKTSTNARL